MPRQIFLFTTVTDSSAEFLIRQLLELDRESNEEITIFINSPGGSVLSLFAIIDTMNIVKSKIRTVVIGQAASAAAIIAATGDVRLITENSEFMLHEVFAFAFGTKTQIDEQTKRIEKLQKRLLGILSKATGKSIDQLASIIKNKDKEFNAKQALSFGLADKIIKSNEAQLLKLSEDINVEGYEIQFEEEGLSEVQLLREGKFTHTAYGEVRITEEMLTQMLHNFDTRVRGIDISIDYTHENDGGESPAACWIKSLRVLDTADGKGLFASVEFTPKGKKLIQEKEYKYASADFSIDYMTEDGEHVPYVLRGGTLTNRPVIKEMNPIKLSEYNPTKEEINQMNKEALITALKDVGVDVIEYETKITTLEAENLELQNQIKELNTLPAESEAEIKSLKEKLNETNELLAKNEKEKVFNILVTEGKILPAQKDSVFETFTDSEKMEAFYKDAPVIVNLEPEGGDEEGTDDTLSEAEEAVVASGEFTREEIIANRTKEKSKEKK